MDVCPSGRDINTGEDMVGHCKAIASTERSRLWRQQAGPGPLSAARKSKAPGLSTQRQR